MRKDGLVTNIPLRALISDKGFKNYLRDIVEDGVKKVGGFLLGDPTEHVHAHGGTPQTDVTYFMVPCEPAFESTPTWAEIPIDGCPELIGVAIEFNYLGFTAVTVPADAGGVVGDLEHVDDSDSDTVSNLVAAYDFTAATARVINDIYNGKKVLDPGDTVNMEMATDGAISTPGTGHGFLVGHRVLQRMAA